MRFGKVVFYWFAMASLTFHARGARAAFPCPFTAHAIVDASESPDTHAFIALTKDLIERGGLSAEALDEWLEQGSHGNPALYVSSHFNRSATYAARKAFDELIRTGGLEWGKIERALRTLEADKAKEEQTRRTVHDDTHVVWGVTETDEFLVPPSENVWQHPGRSWHYNFAHAPDGKFYLRYAIAKGGKLEASAIVEVGSGSRTVIPEDRPIAVLAAAPEGKVFAVTFYRKPGEVSHTAELRDADTGEIKEEVPITTAEINKHLGQLGSGISFEPRLYNNPGGGKSLFMDALGVTLNIDFSTKKVSIVPYPSEIRKHSVPSSDGKDVYLIATDGVFSASPGGELVVRSLIDGKERFRVPITVARESLFLGGQDYAWVHSGKNGDLFLVMADKDAKLHVYTSHPDGGSSHETVDIPVSAQPMKDERPFFQMMELPGQEPFLVFTLSNRRLYKMGLQSRNVVEFPVDLEGGDLRTDPLVVRGSDAYFVHSALFTKKPAAVTVINLNDGSIHSLPALVGGFQPIQLGAILPDGRLMGYYGAQVNGRWGIKAIQLYGTLPKAGSKPNGP